MSNVYLAQYVQLFGAVVQLMFLKSVCFQLVLLTEFAFYASTGAVNIAVAFPIRTVLSRKCTSV